MIQKLKKKQKHKHRCTEALTQCMCTFPSLCGWQVHNLGLLFFTSWNILPSMSYDRYVALIAMIKLLHENVRHDFVAYGPL